MPKKVAQHGGRLIIVNLQKTPLDSEATLIVHTTIDQFMEEVLNQLRLIIPPFILSRRIAVTKIDEELNVSGIDRDGTPYQFIKSLKLGFEDDNIDVKEENISFNYQLKEKKRRFKYNI